MGPFIIVVSKKKKKSMTILKHYFFAKFNNIYKKKIEMKKIE
jgi:hypothetical protein